VSVCVCIRTHTHIARGVLGCEPRGRDETLRGPEESRWTNLGIYVFKHAYNVQRFVCMLRDGVRSWTNCFFSLT